MTTSPGSPGSPADTQVPEPPPAPTGPTGPTDPGPRVSASELRDLAALRRSRSDKRLAGVAGGIARHLDIDPLIVRVSLVVLVFFGGAGLILYVLGWILVPRDGQPRAAVPLDDRNRTVALVLVGVLASLSLLGDSLGGFGFPWPVFVLALVVLVVLLFRGRRDDASRTTTWSTAAPAGSSAASAHPGHPTPYDAPVAVPRRTRPGPVLFWYALALVAIGIGVLGSVDLAGVDVPGSAYPAVALVTSGAMLVLGSVWGRPGGLIALGLLGALATAAATAGGELDTGRIEQTPTSSSSVEATYDLDVGEIVLDLSEVTDTDGLDGRVVDLEVELGRVEVVVPDDVSITVRSELGAGDSTVLGVENEVGRSTDELTAGADAPVLTLDVRVGLGDIAITREGDDR